MHTFHLSYDEMDFMLDNVSLLLGVPCAGIAVGVRDIGVTWCEEFLGWFGAAVRRDGLAPLRKIPRSEKHDPVKGFLL